MALCSRFLPLAIAADGHAPTRSEASEPPTTPLFLISKHFMHIRYIPHTHIHHSNSTNQVLSYNIVHSKLAAPSPPLGPITFVQNATAHQMKLHFEYLFDHMTSAVCWAIFEAMKSSKNCVVFHAFRVFSAGVVSAFAS
ncbi:hypothetical protein DFS34DRAFT_252932 [Phlyctochytrium arcticum]|nr:hypothetical protein DFS34DRAFT_252932 [Phlyctochytrium arcticum]